MEDGRLQDNRRDLSHSPLKDVETINSKRQLTSSVFQLFDALEGNRLEERRFNLFTKRCFCNDTGSKEPNRWRMSSTISIPWLGDIASPWWLGSNYSTNGKYWQGDASQQHSWRDWNIIQSPSFMLIQRIPSASTSPCRSQSDRKSRCKAHIGGFTGLRSWFGWIANRHDVEPFSLLKTDSDMNQNEFLDHVIGAWVMSLSMRIDAKKNFFFQQSKKKW